MTIDDILAARTAQYGDFADHAPLLEMLHDICTPTHPEQWTASMRVGLYYILGKVCRLVLGNPQHADTWQDIAGYALLAARSLEGTAETPSVQAPPALEALRLPFRVHWTEGECDGTVRGYNQGKYYVVLDDDEGAYWVLAEELVPIDDEGGHQ